MPKELLDALVEAHGRIGETIVPARLQAMLALLESLRSNPSLNLSDHLSPAGQSFVRHEPLAKSAMLRLGIQPLNKNSGRRSSNLGTWGTPLLEILEGSGFSSATLPMREGILDDAQKVIGTHLRRLVEEGPLTIKSHGKSVETIVGELLKLAEQKGKAGDVAQYLVGAKLSIRLGREIPVRAANKGDRKSHGDKAARLGDFEIESSVIEVAVGLPDEKHLEQVEEILEQTDKEVWLLTRESRLSGWKNEIVNRFGKRTARVVVVSVEAFVGQNITELAGFSAAAKIDRIRELVECYNTRWVDIVGTPQLRIQVE